MKDLFEIIPAIDILDGKCVRLTQGQYNKVEEFSNNPIDIAKRWVDLGAKRLHVIDLNGAKDGYPANLKIITQLTRDVKATVQVGGGVRTLKTIKDYLNVGVKYLILGTKAFQDNKFLKEVLGLYNEQIIVGLDLRNDKVAVSGWQKTTDLGIEQLTSEMIGVKQIIYTDITKDGMLSGPNLKSVSEIASIFNSNIIVSGGMSTLDDIVSLLNLKKKGFTKISGAILGKSLYKGTIDLTSAIQAVEKELNA